MILLQLYLEFCKVGLFAVGGGLATVPFLYDLSNRTAWFSHADIANMIAIAESTPGPIGVNMATYAGFKTAGVAGSVLATLGLVTPAVIIITIIARILKHFLGNPYVDHAFTGLRPASVALISAAGISVAKISMLNLAALESGGNPAEVIVWKAFLLGAALFLGQKAFPKIHPVVLIVIAAAAGILFHFG